MTRSVCRLVYNHFPRLAPALAARLDPICAETAHQVAARAVASMAAPKHGRAYRRGRRVHIASAPGEAPAIDTGALAASVRVDRVRPHTWRVTFHAPYAKALEYGTPRLAERPFLRPALAHLAGPFFDRVHRILGRG